MKFLPLLIAMAVGAALAQLPTPKSAGATAGHHIFVVKDLEKANEFWHAMGAGDGELPPILKMIKFPGALFYIRQDTKGTNTGGGTEGSSVEFLGFKVKDLKMTLANLDKIGYKPLPGAKATEAFVMAPDAIKVKLTEEKALATAVTADEVHIIGPKGSSDFYAKYFGGPNIPGARLTFSEVPVAKATTKGRSLNTIGFEVTDLKATYDKLKEAGLVSGTIATNEKAGLSVFTFTAPDGTFLEISQGLNKVK
jgi:hypothetical protein